MSRPPVAFWGIDAELQPLAGGHRNTIVRTVGLQRNLVFKSTRRSLAAIEWLEPVHAYARDSGFIVPLMKRSNRGRLIESGWTCEEFVEGEAFDKTLLPKILPEISRFHQCAANVPQRPGFASSKELINVNAGGDVDLLTIPYDVAEMCRAAWRELFSPVTIVHGDLNPGNLLRCQDGQTALLDWDECRRDMSIFDLGQLAHTEKIGQQAILAWEVACSWSIEPDHARQVLRKLIDNER